MPVQVQVKKSNDELVFYAEEIPDSDYNSSTDYRYTLPNTTESALATHLQGKVAAGQDVGRVFVVASTAVGNLDGYLFNVARAVAADGVVPGYVGALGGILRIPSKLSDVRDIRAVYRNFGDDQEYAFASGSYSMLVRVAPNKDIVVVNNSNVARYVRVTASGTPIGGGS